MKLTYNFDDDFGMTEVTFEGLTGCEFVINTRDALNVMKVKNPALDFNEDVKNGLYNDLTDEEYEQVLETIRRVRDLWRYPGAPQDGAPEGEMNILMLLANAIELISRQEVQLRKCRREQ